jgi:hypothetical protein
MVPIRHSGERRHDEKLRFPVYGFARNQPDGIAEIAIYKASYFHG